MNIGWIGVVLIGLFCSALEWLRDRWDDLYWNVRWRLISRAKRRAVLDQLRAGQDR